MPNRCGAGNPSVADEKLEEEQLQQRIEEELRKLKVQDILLQTSFTLASLGFRSLGEENRDLEQGRLAIDALRALVPVLREAMPPEVVRDLEQTLANMQLTYAGAAKSSE
jgi:hypothetical protein